MVNFGEISTTVGHPTDHCRVVASGRRVVSFDTNSTTVSHLTDHCGEGCDHCGEGCDHCAGVLVCLVLGRLFSLVRAESGTGDSHDGYAHQHDDAAHSRHKFCRCEPCRITVQYVGDAGPTSHHDNEHAL